MRFGVRQFSLPTVLILLTLLAPACRATNDDNDALPTPDHEGVLHDLTEVSAEQLLGFRPVRPSTLPSDLAVHELWGQSSILPGTATDGTALRGAPYTAVYTLWPTKASSMRGGMQLHQSPISPIPTEPGVNGPEQLVTIGTKLVQKVVAPIGDTGFANVVYRWTGATTNLRLLVIATTGGLLTEAEVETMIAALPD